MGGLWSWLLFLVILHVELTGLVSGLAVSGQSQESQALQRGSAGGAAKGGWKPPKFRQEGDEDEDEDEEVDDEEEEEEDEDGECHGTGADGEIYDAMDMILAAANAPGRPQDINTKHAVVVVPGSFASDVAANLAAGVYGTLPRTIKENTYTSAFTKFVVVGYAEQPGGPAGVSLGADVCGEEGWSYVDEDSLDFLSVAAPRALGHRCPVVLDCEEPKNCVEEIGPAMNHQLFFLQAMTNRSLKGNLLPIMLQKQDLRVAVAVGDALALLTASGAIWEAQRVLFVFASDMSEGLTAKQATHCDTLTTKFMTERGVTQVADYLYGLQEGRTTAGCGEEALPRGWSMLVAAARTASLLGLTRNRVAVAREKQANVGKEDKVNGFASIVYWEDIRDVHNRVGSRTQQVSPDLAALKVASLQQQRMRLRASASPAPAVLAALEGAKQQDSSLDPAESWRRRRPWHRERRRHRQAQKLKRAKRAKHA